jgi:hypothetical protein
MVGPQIGRCGFPNAVPISSVKIDFRLGCLEQLLHARFTSRNEGRHARDGQVGHGPLHGMHDFGGHMSGPWRVNKSDARDARCNWGNHDFYFN